SMPSLPAEYFKPAIPERRKYIDQFRFAIGRQVYGNMAVIDRLSLQDLFLNNRCDDKAVIRLKVQSQIIIRRRKFLQHPLAHDMFMFGSGGMIGLKACVVAEVDGLYFFECAGLCRDIVKVIDD